MAHKRHGINPINGFLHSTFGINPNIVVTRPREHHQHQCHHAPVPHVTWTQTASESQGTTKIHADLRTNRDSSSVAADCRPSGWGKLWEVCPRVPGKNPFSSPLIAPHPHTPTLTETNKHGRTHTLRQTPSRPHTMPTVRSNSSNAISLPGRLELPP